MMLSDDRGCSITRVCTDDFGSALRAMNTLRTHSSAFDLARRVAGLCLKPSKCVLVISCFALREETVLALRTWLRVNVLAFAEFIIADAGKYCPERG